MELIDRHAECGVLDRLIEAVRAGESRALVVSGEAGVGKTALLDYLAGQASGCRLARIAGVQSEMELPFAALHQLCAPMLDKLQGLPAPQRDALKIAFGMSSGSAPDRFLVGLALLSLLSDAAEQQPLVCVVDDEQWLDRASAQVLGFAARRLGAESVGLVFAARTPSNDIAGLPDLVVERLGETDARALLDAALTGPLDYSGPRSDPCRDSGQPAGFAGIASGIDSAGASWRIWASQRDAIVRRHRRELPPAARRSPRPDPASAADRRCRAGRRSGAGVAAAARLGIGAEATAPATEASLVEFGMRVRFRHPLVRSVVYGSALPQERQRSACGAWRRSPIRDKIPIDAPGIGRNAAPGPDEDGRRGIGAVGRPGAGAWRYCCGSGIPRARHGVDARPRPPHRAGAGSSVGQSQGRRVRRGSGPALYRGGWAAERLSASPYRFDWG